MQEKVRSLWQPVDTNLALPREDTANSDHTSPIIKTHSYTQKLFIFETCMDHQHQRIQ